jgi:phage tail sheath protein FI
MDYLYDGAVSGGGGINPLRFAPGRGILIWGQKTLLGRPSSLSRLNVRLLLCVIEPAIAKTLEDFLFEINDAATRAQVTSVITDYMTIVKARRGVYAFDIVCDDTNNPPAVIDQYQMIVDLYIQPIQSIEYIPFRLVITRTGSALAINQAAVNAGA